MIFLNNNHKYVKTHENSIKFWVLKSFTGCWMPLASVFDVVRFSGNIALDWLPECFQIVWLPFNYSLNISIIYYDRIFEFSETVMHNLRHNLPHQVFNCRLAVQVDQCANGVIIAFVTGFWSSGCRPFTTTT